MPEAEALVAFLKARGLTLATAESCTGGGVAHAVTSVAGASEVFPGGVVSYTNAVKAALLGVPEETLRRFGAVSPQTAAAMAEGARRRLGADLAVSVTGLAGPGGGTRETPVGLVWFGLADGSGVETVSRRFAGDRSAVREQAVRLALTLPLTGTAGAGA